jgi:ribosome-associated protein
LSKSVLPKVSKASAEKTSAKKASAKVTSAKATTAKATTAKPAAKTARKTSTKAAALKAQPDADKTLNMILSRLDDMKAEETVTIDLRGKSAFSDYMIVTTGRANRHVGAIAENVTKALKETGIKGIHVEGLPNCDWVLIDSGDVVVHVFRPEVREFYNLERLWTQSPAAAKAI